MEQRTTASIQNEKEALAILAAAAAAAAALPNSKIMPRALFEALPPAVRMAHVKAGGTLKD